MSQTKKTYTLGKIKQLVDLNGDSTNFDLTFKVTCKDNTPFNLLVVDQTTLDNSPELDYKEAKGTISGNIVADKNVFQNYFLILKSETPCVVDVELFKKELPKTPDVNMAQPPVPPNHGVQRHPTRQNRMMNPPKQGTNWLKIVLIVMVVVGGLALLWYLYKKPSEKSEEKRLKFDSHVPSNREEDGEPYFNSFVTRHTSPVKRTPASPSVHSSSTHEETVYKSSKNPEYKSSSYEPKPSYKPKYTLPVKNSPDAMSNASSARSEALGGGTLLDRLRKYAR